MENNIEKIQEYLMLRLDRLNDDDYMKEHIKDEIARSNAVTNSALAYMKMENLKIRVNSLSSDERNHIKRLSE